MGRPQNLVSRSLWIRSCLMYLVVPGSGIGGNDLVQPDGDRRGGIRARLDRHLLGRAVEVAGRFVPLLAFAAVHGQLDDVPVAAVKRFIEVNQSLNTVTPRRKERRLSSG